MKSILNTFDKNRNTVCFKFIRAFVFLFLLSTTFANSENKAVEKKQARIINGLVLDAHTKKPISAAQITVASENLSAITDDKGHFTLTLKSLKDVLKVSAYDYNKTEVPVRGKDSLVIELYSDQFSPYFKNVETVTGNVSNSSLTSSVKSVDDLKFNNAMAVDEVLQTKLGGNVRAISRSGVPGIGASLFIRGINSLNANSQPLFVIDGVIWNNLYDVQFIHEGFFSNPLDNIDVNDIENISVIKDGTSIYGSKASNGVIVITTKRSKTMVTKISVNILSGTTDRPGTLPVMGGEDFRVYASDLLKSKGGITGNDISGYGFLETDRSQLKVYNSNHNITNWADEVYQKGTTNSYLINANGGDEKALYYLSLGYTNNKGVVKTTDMERINFRLNGDIKMFKFMDMGLNIGFSNVQRTLLDDGMSRYSSPTWISQIKSPFLSPYSYSNTGELTTNYSVTDQFDVANPTGLINRSINDLKKFRFNVGVLPVFKLLPGLTLGSQFDYSLDKTVEGRFVPMYYTPQKYMEGYGFSENEVNSQVMRNINVFDDTRLTFDKKFNAYNQLKAILGMRYIYNFYESDYSEEHNTGANNITTITGDHDYLQVRGLNNYTKSISNYVNVDYSYNSRYLLSATVSMDGSSRFGKETKGGISFLGNSWGVFPAVNAGWVVSSERFMKPFGFVNFLKVRGGYGLTGNDGIKDYEAMAYFSSVRFMDKANGLALSNLENSAVQWETTAKANVGADLNLFNNRLSLSADYFRSNTSDLLVLRDLPDVSGLGKYWHNGGEMTNEGYEVSAALKLLNFKKFKWELGLNVGHYVNKITSLEDGQYTTSVYGGEILTAVGQSAGSFYGYKTKGVFATEAEATQADLKILNQDGTYSDFMAGDVIFDDTNNDHIIDSKDKQVIGNPNPDLYGSFSSKMSLRRFTLNALFTYSYGNDVYNYKRSLLESGSDLSNQSMAMMRRWTAEGQVTDQPKAVYGDPMGNARFSDRWIEDGSYIRLKTISLSYELPIKNDFIEGFSIWVSANNLLTLTNYLGLDPEFSAGNSVYYQGVDAGLIPQTKSYYVGVKINL